MNWKSTVFVSGAGLLATWLASVPAPSTTAQQASAPRAATPQAQPQAPLSTEIIHEADRLERRNRTGAAFNHPARNLFRFGQVRSVARPASAAVAGTLQTIKAVDTARPNRITSLHRPTNGARTTQ